MYDTPDFLRLDEYLGWLDKMYPTVGWSENLTVEQLAFAAGQRAVVEALKTRYDQAVDTARYGY